MKILFFKASSKSWIVQAANIDGNAWEESSWLQHKDGVEHLDQGAGTGMLPLAQVTATFLGFEHDAVDRVDLK